MVSSDTATFRLPPDLPPGRFVSDAMPGLWFSDAPVPDPVAVWDRCRRDAGVTGLRPVLCAWVVDPCAARIPESVTDDRLAEDLERSWRSYRALQLTRLDRPCEVPWVPEGIVPYEDDPGPPYEVWPGLAPATAPTPGDDPDDVARRVLGTLVAEPHGGLRESHLALVPAARSGDIPEVMGWWADAPRAELCALLSSWELRFGARVIAIDGATVHVSVAFPPRTAEQASHTALEHVLTGADNVNDGTTPFPDYAASLVGTRLWSFWWD
jgi:Domain of unknown function (DUF4253)